MRRDPLERLSIRAALALGFGLLVALWVIAGWSFSSRLTDLETQATAITARYIEAQDALTIVRTQLNVSSIILRDALLDTEPSAQESYEARIARNYDTIIAAIDAYQPVLDTDDWKPHVDRLRREVEAFWDTTRNVLHQTDGAGRVALLNDQIAPRRAAALALSDEIRALNRRACSSTRPPSTPSTARFSHSGSGDWVWRWSPVWPSPCSPSSMPDASRTACVASAPATSRAPANCSSCRRAWSRRRKKSAAPSPASCTTKSARC